MAVLAATAIVAAVAVAMLVVLLETTTTMAMGMKILKSRLILFAAFVRNRLH